LAAVRSSRSRSHKDRFLQELKRARLEAGLSQVELARRLGRHQSFVSKYESGERRLDVLELREICAELGVSLAIFVRRLERALSGGARR
jgi:transcriptional regulator with XRE-family HTH domain